MPQQAPWLNDAMNLNGEWTSPGQWVSAPTGKVGLASRVVTPKPELPGADLIKNSSGSLSASSVTGAARTLSLTPTAALITAPTSPMKKELFKYPPAEQSPLDRRGTVIGSKLQKIGQEQIPFTMLSSVISGMRSRHSSGAPVADNRKNLVSPVSTGIAAGVSDLSCVKIVDKVHRYLNHFFRQLFRIDFVLKYSLPIVMYIA